jgi:tetratricopeptide (TPR) repeat protein
MYTKAQAALEHYRDNIADIAQIHYDLSENYFFQDKYELSLMESERCLSLDPGHIASKIQKGRIALCQGDLESAEKIFQDVLKSKELGWHLYTRLLLGALYFHRGRYPDAVAQFNQSVDLAEKLQEKWWESCGHMMISFSHLKSGNPEKVFPEAVAIKEAGITLGSLNWQERALALETLAHLETSALAEAESGAEELREFVQKGLNKKKIRDYYFLLGKIELKKDNFNTAINHLEKAGSLLTSEFSFGPFDCDHALFYEPLALAYFKAGRLDKAKEEYRRIQSLNAGKVYFGDTYVLSYYWLGHIFEQQKDNIKARENYEHFLALWNNAGPGRAEVEEAKKRLAVLQE